MSDLSWTIGAAMLSVALGASVAILSYNGSPTSEHSQPESAQSGTLSGGGHEEPARPAPEPARQEESARPAPEPATQDGRQTAPPDPSSPEPEATTVGALNGAEDFDPPPGDGQEHPEEVALAIDGDPTTTWSTERYSAGLAAIGKKGVGIALEAAGAVKAKELVLQSTTPGWSGEVYAADQQARKLADWGEPVGSVSKASANETVALEVPKPARYYLVWITDLGDSETVALSEIG